MTELAFRAFIAVEVPGSPKLEHFSRSIKQTGAPLKMVNLDNVHITLKFLGDTDEALVPDILGVMEEAVENTGPFTMTMKGGGAFPNMKRISVVWAGMENATPLVNIADRLDARLQELGFKPERRKFSPHVTIARVKGGRNKDKLIEVVEKQRLTEFGEVRVDRIILKKSVLTPRGPMYSDMAVVELRD